MNVVTFVDWNRSLGWW